MQLTRLTTCFVEEEDRFLVSADSDAGVINLWLTQRLLKRLLPHLIAWVGSVNPERLAEAGAATVAQDKEGEAVAEEGTGSDENSRHHLTSQLIAQHRKPIPRVAADKAVQSCLVKSLQLHTQQQTLRLVFELPDKDEAVLLLQEEHARMWLGALYKHWQQAQWSDIWPEWMKQAQRMRVASSAPLMH